MKSLVRFNFLPNGLRWEEEIRLVKEFGEYGIYNEGEEYKTSDNGSTKKSKKEHKPNRTILKAIDAGIIKAGIFSGLKIVDSKNSKSGAFDRNYYVKRKVETRDGFNYDQGIYKRFICPCTKIAYTESGIAESTVNNKIIFYKSLVGLNDTMAFVYPTKLDIEEGKYISGKDSNLYSETAMCIRDKVTITRTYTAKGKMNHFWTLQRWNDELGKELTEEKLWSFAYDKIEDIYKIDNLKGKNISNFDTKNKQVESF